MQDLRFGDWLRIYRNKSRLTQKQLADASHVAETTIGDLERGINKRPRADNLQRLIEALGLTNDERDNLRDAWQRDGIRNHRFKQSRGTTTGNLSVGRAREPGAESGSGPGGESGRDVVGIEHQDWGNAPSGPLLFSRGDELGTLKQWIVADRCQVVATIGLRGIGKTNLTVGFGRGGQSAELGRDLARRFDYVVWRSLINAPKLADVLEDIIGFVSNQAEVNLPESIEGRLMTLFSLLGQRKCLIILDNAESILRGGEDVGQYQPGYEDYGKLIRQFATLPHQSCLVLTSREMPEDVAQLQTKNGPLRVLSLTGIDVTGCKRIFEQIDDSFIGTEEEWTRLRQQYDGSPLALDLVARHIVAAYSRDIGAFLRARKLMFRTLEGLLDWYFERFSDLQKEIMYWFAIAREPISRADLEGLLVAPLSRRELPSTLEALQQALPLQRTDAGFTLQPVLIEFMSAKLIATVVTEIMQQHIHLLNSHALLLAQAKDYIRESHRRVFLDPILQSLTGEMGAGPCEQALLRLIQRLQQQPPSLLGYAAGNVINLLLQLGVDVSGQDFSRLYFRQAYLREASLANVNFADARFEKSTFTDMFGNVLSVAFSPYPYDSTVIAAGTGTGDIRLWRASDGMPLATYSGHSDWVWGLAYSPDGKMLASGSSDQTIRLWDTSNGKHLFVLRGHEHRVRSVAFSPDGKLLASASEDKLIGLWDVESGKHLRFCVGHKNPVRAVAFTPDGKAVVSASDDATVRIWDVATGMELIAPLEGHNSQIWSLAVSPDGRTIASGGDDRLVLLWDYATGRQLATLRGHSGWICSLAFSPDGSLLASASADTHVRLWSMETRESVKVLQGHGNWVNSVRFHLNGAVVASGSHDQTVRLWETSSGNSITTLQGYSNGIRAVAFSTSGDLLATADRSIRLWNPSTGANEAVFSGHNQPIRTLAFSQDGRYIASGSDDYSSRIWSLASARKQRSLNGHSNRVKSVAFSPDGTLLATGSDDNTVRLWDVGTPRSRTLEGHTNRIRAVAFSPTGLFVGSGSDDSTARLWNVQTADVFHVLEGHSNRIWSIAFSSDGSLFATGSEDTTIRIWDTLSGKCLHTLRGHSNPVWAIAFRQDGGVLASSSEDQTIRLWDVSTGAVLHVLTGHTKPIWALAFSPDEVRLASGSHDHTVRLWNSFTGQNLAVLTEHRESVWAVAFDPAGRLLASGSDDGTCCVWDVNKKTLLHSLRGARPYERMNIRGVTGMSDAQIMTLMALGAVDDD